MGKRLSVAMLRALDEADFAPDGVAWLALGTLRALEVRGLMARVHPTSSGARMTDAGRAALKASKAKAH